VQNATSYIWRSDTNELFFVTYTHVSRIAIEITGCANRFPRVQQLLHGNCIINVTRDEYECLRACLCDIGLPRAYGEFCACPQICNAGFAQKQKRIAGPYLTLLDFPFNFHVDLV